MGNIVAAAGLNTEPALQLLGGGGEGREQRANGRVGTLYAVTVARARRRQGLGQELVRAAVRHGGETLGLQWICLSTCGADNVSFYKKCGFHVFKQERGGKGGRPQVGQIVWMKAPC